MPSSRAIRWASFRVLTGVGEIIEDLNFSINFIVFVYYYHSPFLKRSSAVICLLTFLEYILLYRPKGVT